MLSDRESELFQLIGQGCDTRQIAEELEISFKTVQSFAARIKERLGLASATKLQDAGANATRVRWREAFGVRRVHRRFRPHGTLTNQRNASFARKRC